MCGSVLDLEQGNPDLCYVCPNGHAVLPHCSKCGAAEILAPGLDYYCPNCKVDLKDLFVEYKQRVKPTPMANPGVAIGVMVQHPTNGCLLLGKRKGELGGGQYAIPGGKVDFGETPFTTVMREIKEETNLDLCGIYFTGKVTNDYFPDRGKQYITLYYLATAINPQDLKTREPDKVEEWKWIDPAAELPEPMWMHTGNLLKSALEYEKGRSPSDRWDFKTSDIDGRS